MQRWLRENWVSEEIELPRTRKELLRVAARRGLISDAVPWFGYGDARNITTHTYDEAKAQAVYEVAIRFLNDARALLNRLDALND